MFWRVIGERSRALQERPAAGSGDLGGVRAERVPERLPCPGGQHFPPGRSVARGIAGSGPAPVEHPAGPAVQEDGVAEVEVAVAPRRRAVPCRGLEGLVPRGHKPLHVVAGIELRGAVTHPAVQLVERAAPQAGRRFGRVDRTEGKDQLRELDGGSLRVPDLADRDVLPLDPGEDGPGKRESLGRIAAAERLGDRERQLRGEPRQPFELTLESLDLARLARQPYKLVGAKPVVRVVGPTREHGLDRQVGPLGERTGDETLHEGRVGVDLVRVHPSGQPPP